MRPTDLVPKFMCDMLLACARRDPDWVRWEWLDVEGDGTSPRGGYKIGFCDWVPPFITLNATSGADWCGFKAMSRWMADGPKTFQITAEQAQALEQVDVNLPLRDYEQPYPAVMVQLPKGLYGQFTAVLCFLDATGGPDRMLTCSMYSEGHVDDLVTTVGAIGVSIEDSIQRFDPDCGSVQATAPRALRVAVNACLALANYGCTARWMFPHDRDRDLRLAVERTERGARARDRLTTCEQLLSFSQEIKLHATQDGAGADVEAGAGHGPEKSCHWRRGHWAMQPFGPGRSQRRRIFRKPILVRGDRFVGDTANTCATYKG